MGCGEVGPHVITVTGNVVRGSEESPGIERAEITLDISAVTLPKAKERLGEDHPVVVLYEETLGSLAALVEEAKEQEVLLREVACSGHHVPDSRIDWIDVQVDRDIWAKLRKRVEAATQAEQEGAPR